jgi:hypothetical protein
MSKTTVTLMPPGFTVSWQPAHTPPPSPPAARAPRTPPSVLLTLRVTVVLRPASSRPEDGATDSLPTRPGDSVMDHCTGPPDAVSVTLPPDSALTTIVLGVTLSVPVAGGGVGGALVAVAVALLDGAGELGDGLWLDGEGDGEGPPGTGDVPPGEGEGNTWAGPLAGPAGCAGLPGLLCPPGRTPPVRPGWVPGAVPPDEAPPVPVPADPRPSALSRP